MVSKEQERKALEQIKKIVEGLGNDSYIAVAFEGCFEIAEENIENDFGCSMAQSLRDAECKIHKKEEELTQIRKDLEVSRWRAESYKEAWKEAEQKKLDTIDLNVCLKPIESRVIEVQKKMNESAYKIADNVDNPTCDDFVLAAKTYRESKDELEYLDGLIGLIERINAAKA